jgi:response regulator of citrate/malate metabolism
MPYTGPFQLRHAIREFDPHSPILFYTAVACAKEIQERLQAGAQAYLVKPIKRVMANGLLLANAD